MKSKKTQQTEELLVRQMKENGLPTPVREFRFHPTRKWRTDIAYPDKKILIECEGGTWSGGRHTRGYGFEGDCEKYNQAATLGYKVLRFTTKMIKDGRAILAIQEALA